MKKYRNLSFGPTAWLCTIIVLCAGLLTACDDDDNENAPSYNEKSIEYAYQPHTGDGMTTEWIDFNTEYTNSGDTVMTVSFNPCKTMYSETTFTPDDPASFTLQGVNFRDTIWVNDVTDYNGEAIAVVGREIPYISDTYRSEPDWSRVPDELIEVQPHTSVYYNGQVRVDHIQATYTLTVEDAVTLETKEFTGKIIKIAPTAWKWGEFNPYPDAEEASPTRQRP